MSTRTTSLATILLSSLAAAALAPSAAAQCTREWTGLGFGPNNGVRALAVYNDGTGPALYAGGRFTTADGLPATEIARWDGTSWSPVASGLCANAIIGMATHTDASGTALYAGGSFDIAIDGAGETLVNHIVKWDGHNWSPLGVGMNHTVTALLSFNDGFGPALYAAGYFSSAGGVPAGNVARWNGSSWSALGTGMANFVQALAVYDDGTGPALYAAGLFFSAGGNAINSIARWNSSTGTWLPLGSGTSNGVDSTVWAMAVYDDGSGPALYVGGDFTHAGGVPANRLAKWNGSAWSAVGGSAGADSQVDSMLVYDDGSGPALYVGGAFNSINGVSVGRIARYQSGVWSRLGANGLGYDTAYPVYSMVAFNNGTGPALYAGGYFGTANGAPANFVARYGCPPGTQGVCCRGATCATTLQQADCTVSTGAAGALFVSSASTCNAAPTANSPCCYADYNKTAGITVNDIFDFLGDWFAGSPFAATGSSGAPTTLSVQNIFDFLAGWFAGGCN